MVPCFPSIQCVVSMGLYVCLQAADLGVGGFGVLGCKAAGTRKGRLGGGGRGLGYLKNQIKSWPLNVFCQP
jgi:hypothetical protein